MSEQLKKELTERDICTKYITPALASSAWDIQSQIREEVSFTAGRIFVHGTKVKRGDAQRADYVLYYKPNIPIAVIEAKDNNHSVGSGMQQALGYADVLDVPFAFSSNGDGFLEHDRTCREGTVEREIPLSSFPTPGELWKRYCTAKGIVSTTESIIAQDYHADVIGKTPRYYQQIAINRTIEAIIKGQNRILLVMAAGTGKTYTAFQIIWRLWRARAKRRILFLADRNILVDQTRINDFKPFESAMTKITNRQVDKSYEIYLSLYQAVTGDEEEKNIYKQFTPDFFDLIIVDECHRGSAAADSAWREVIDYFSSATQIGMTATPKETRDVSNIDYFGEPIYTYSLRQGIEDGFLAPYKVVRIDIDKDLQGWRPPAGKRDKHGRLVEDRIYNQIDFDRTLVLEKRTELVARKVTEFLRLTDRFDKTIIFCEDIDHAERMRQDLVNENADLVAASSKYIMRITGDDNEGKMELDSFIDPESRFPVIVTTSKLLSTGVDAQTCKLIVLDQRIQSMTLFKQIIGRGTRIREEYDKFFFTIMDFKKATELFADPDFDGDPVQIYEPEGDASPVPPDEEIGEEQVAGKTLQDMPPPPTGEKRVKYIIDDVPVMIVAERVQYYGTDGKLITESLRDYTRKSVRKEFQSLDAFLTAWSHADRKSAIISELERHGVLLEALAEEVGKDLDPFDLVCHVAWDQPPRTRHERAENVRKRDYFARYGEKACNVLNALLDKYADEGIVPIEDITILNIHPISDFGTPLELVAAFGGRQKYLEAVQELEQLLYAA
ncbi:MAG TPA: DEAD/DEAH box helicase family protein [Thermodesulfobacteriota bacterium]|nr:DEAD/DEAH box helicase family protein [Thermodesulfobacteriota bacterium]